MRQTLFYIPPEVFGLPVFGFGVAFFALLAAVLVAGGLRFRKTRKFDEDLWNYLGLLFVGGLILVFVAPNVLEPKGFPIRGYGTCLLLAILAALGLVLLLSRRRNIPSEQIFSLCLWTVVSGIAGARIFYVTEYWPQMVVRDAIGNLDPGATLFNLFNLAQGGLVVFGGILGGILGAVVFMLRNKMPVPATFDSMAPAMMLGLSIGRLGCFLNGCCYGGPTDACWGVVFPEGSPAHIHQIEHGDTYYYGLRFKEKTLDGTTRIVLDAVQPGSDASRANLEPGLILRGIGESTGKIKTRRDVLLTIDYYQHKNPADRLRFEFRDARNADETKAVFLGPAPSPVLPVHPTQIYSSIAAASLCGVLLLLGRLRFFRCRDGLVFAAFLVLYPVVRFCLEMIRTDEDSFLGTGLTVSQNVSIAVFIAGVCLSVYLIAIRKKDGSPA